jgi:hypothetical protein
VTQKSRITKIGRIGCDSLNESAALVFARGSYLSRQPSSPTFWFYTLAIDARADTFGPNLRALLSDESKALLEFVDVGDFESASDYCTCVDDAVRFWGLYGREHRGRIIEPCYACAFSAHDHCSVGCDSSGMISFPERILDPRVKAAA